MPFLSISSEEERETISLRQARRCAICSIRRPSGSARVAGDRGPAAFAVSGSKRGRSTSPTKNEIFLLSQEDLRRGIRLACQIAPKGDLRLGIVNPAPKSSWRSLRPEEIPAGPPSVPAPRKRQRRQTLRGRHGPGDHAHKPVPLGHGRKPPLIGAVRPEPATRYGSDVMTRLVYADGPGERGNGKPGGKGFHQRGLRDICSREGYDPKKIGHMVSRQYGHAFLLARRNFELLLRPEYWASEIDCAPVRMDGWFVAAGLDDGRFGRDRAASCGLRRLGPPRGGA